MRWHEIDMQMHIRSRLFLVRPKATTMMMLVAIHWWCWVALATADGGSTCESNTSSCLPCLAELACSTCLVHGHVLRSLDKKSAAAVEGPVTAAAGTSGVKKRR